MPVRSDEPLRKVTLNLYEADCKFLERYLGRGWTERIREQVRMYVTAHQNFKPVRRTLGDLNDI